MRVRRELGGGGEEGETMGLVGGERYVHGTNILATIYFPVYTE